MESSSKQNSNVIPVNIHSKVKTQNPQTRTGNKMCYLLDGLSLKVRSSPMAVPVRPRNTPETEITKNENP
jgi:hypothetical protein